MTSKKVKPQMNAFVLYLENDEFILKELYRDILSHSCDVQNYFQIEGNLKIR